MSNECQSPNSSQRYLILGVAFFMSFLRKQESSTFKTSFYKESLNLGFNHLSFIWHFDFEIWVSDLFEIKDA